MLRPTSMPSKRCTRFERWSISSPSSWFLISLSLSSYLSLSLSFYLPIFPTPVVETNVSLVQKYSELKPSQESKEFFFCSFSLSIYTYLLFLCLSGLVFDLTRLPGPFVLSTPTDFFTHKTSFFFFPTDMLGGLGCLPFGITSLSYHRYKCASVLRLRMKGYSDRVRVRVGVRVRVRVNGVRGEGWGV